MLIELELNAREFPFFLNPDLLWGAPHLLLVVCQTLLFLPIVIWKTFPTCRIEYLYLLLTLASSEMCWEGFIVNEDSMLQQFIAMLEYYQELLKW